MRRSVDGRAAASRCRRAPDSSGSSGARLARSACRAAGASSVAAPRRATAWADTARPAPSTRQVAGRCLDVDRVLGDAEARRSPPRIASSRTAEPRPRADDRHIDATRREAGAASRATTAPSSSRLAMPRGVRASGRKQPPEVAQPGRAQQRVGDRVEDDVAVGVAVKPRRARDRRRRRGPAAAGPERVACPSRTRPGRRAGRRRVLLDAVEGPPGASP